MFLNPNWRPRAPPLLPPYEIEHDIIYNENMVLSPESAYNMGDGYTELMSAVIQHRSAEDIDYLIRRGESVNHQNRLDDYKTALHYAVSHRSCDLDVILTLLNRGADINSISGRDGRTPLHYAVQNPFMKPEIIRALLARQGADVNVLSGGNGDGLSVPKFTPLHYALAAQSCKEEIVNVLLNHRADLREDSAQLLPIHVALLNINCSMDVIKLLIQTGSPVSNVCSAGSPLFILLCRPDCDVAVVKLVLRLKADPNFAMPIRGFRHSLKWLRCSNVMNTIIENFNPQISTKSPYRYAKPLVAGLIQPNLSPDDYELLLKYGGDPNLSVPDSQTLLSVAVNSEKVDVQKLRVLLKKGAKFNRVYPRFRGSLFAVLCAAAPGVLQAIMEYKDNFEQLQNQRGCNLLHYAFKEDASPDTLMLLMKYFPPSDQTCVCKSSALHHAVKSSCPLHIIECLLEQSTCVDVRDLVLDTPLHLAGARPDVVKMLLRYGADTTLLNDKQQTPFHVYFEYYNWSFQMLQNVIKSMVLNEYMANGYFDSKMFVDNLCDPFPFKTDEERPKKKERETLKIRIEELKKDLIPFIQDCQSELGYACTLDPSIFFLLVSRFSLKLHLRKGLMKPKTICKEGLISIKEKMFQTLHDKKLLWILASNEIPLYQDFLLLLLNKKELIAVASELKIPTKSKGLEEFEYAPPVSIYLVAQYLTFSDLDNLILAFLKSLGPNTLSCP